MVHGESILLCNPWLMGNYTVVQPMTDGNPYHCTTHDPWGIHIIVQPMPHGVAIPLHNPRPMGKPYCYAIHDPWDPHTVAQPMTHGGSIPFCNPWPMGQQYHCTTHDPWESHTIAQPMPHGAAILLHNPCGMGYQYHCMLHAPWIIQCYWFPMGHGLCNVLHNVVWSMTHGEKITEGAHWTTYWSTQGLPNAMRHLPKYPIPCVDSSQSRQSQLQH